MGFCVIVCDRGDRPELMSFCRHQLERMTTKPDKIYFVDHPPENRTADLTKRIRIGIDRAKVDCIERIFIVESDDWYISTYFDQMLKAWPQGVKIIGAKSTINYNLRYNSWQQDEHPDRSSLHHTAFDISALDRFTMPDDDFLFLDRKLWTYINRQHIPAELIAHPLVVSMKHGMGKTAGRGHHMNYQKKDPDRSYLKSIVDSEAYAFYQSLKI